MLSALDEKMTTFLLEGRPSCPRFSADLLDTLLQRQDSAMLLEASPGPGTCS